MVAVKILNGLSTMFECLLFTVHWILYNNKKTHTFRLSNLKCVVSFVVDGFKNWTHIYMYIYAVCLILLLKNRNEHCKLFEIWETIACFHPFDQQLLQCAKPNELWMKCIRKLVQLVFKPSHSWVLRVTCAFEHILVINLKIPKFPTDWLNIGRSSKSGFPFSLSTQRHH